MSTKVIYRVFPAANTPVIEKALTTVTESVPAGLLLIKLVQAGEFPDIS